MNFQEVQKYITPIHYMHWIAPALIGEQYYRSLSADMKEALKKAVANAALHEQKWAKQYSDEALKALLKAGMELTELEDEEIWKNKARSVWPRFYDKVGGKELVDKALKYLAQ